ncbi:tetratricopeptide repeat protein [bacterium]|nr:tetratricopeptide repeat protein [bacterium]
MTKAILKTLKYNLQRALGKGCLHDAEEILARIKKEDPVSRETRSLELEFYLAANRFDEANEIARQLRNLFPDSAHILFLAGKLAYRQKQYAEAASRLRESYNIEASWQTQWWLGKALTQSGQFEEAESHLLSACERSPHVLLDLAWLYERMNDLEGSMKAYQKYLDQNPGHAFASEQLVRIKAKMLEPEALIEEVDSISEMEESISQGLLPEFVQRLFEMGQSIRAREEVLARQKNLDPKVAVRVAWVCYRSQAYDLASSLFLAHLHNNVSNYKYLTALESAAAKSLRLVQVLESYKVLSKQAPHLYGRIRTIARRLESIKDSHE